MALDALIRPAPTGTLLDVRVVPGASRCALVLEPSGRLKVRLDAPPVDGKANERLIQYLAREVFRIPKSAVSIVKGELGREKTILLTLSLDEAKSVLERVLHP